MSDLPSKHPGADLEAAVRERYGEAARVRESALCCPTSYDARLLEALPADVIERDYGCGDLRRGMRTAVCGKTFGIYAREPYRDHVDLIEPHVLVPLEDAPAFACTGAMVRRDPRETKGVDYDATTDAAPVCETGSCC